MTEKRTWKEFRDIKLLWFINTILHLFGWAITVDVDDDGEITDVYPARVKFRGFPEEINTKGYIELTKYLRDNADTLVDEAEN